jgi:hypothetical protein
MGKILVLGSLAAAVLTAQTAITTASVSGVVRDKTNGQPLARYIVSTYINASWIGGSVISNAATKEVKSTTDASGRYKLTGLPPGSYRVRIRNPLGSPNAAAREVIVTGSDVESIDFRVLVEGMIAGKVVDEDHKPVSGMWVRLVSREYEVGSLGYFYGTSTAVTNKDGKYTLTGVSPARVYFVIVERNDRDLPAHSEVPSDRKLRKAVAMPTWYPNSPSKEGAQGVILRPGERRDGVDIEMRKSPSYCLEGTAMGPAGAAAMHFGIETLQPSNGLSSGVGAFASAPPGGVTAADGKFRICDLNPGSYRLSVEDANRTADSVPAYGAVEFAVVDQDIQGIKILAAPGRTLEAEAAWDGDPPASPVALPLRLLLEPLNGAGGQRGGQMAIPGRFTFKGVVSTDYAVLPFSNVPGVYVKDIGYAGRSAMYDPLRMGIGLGGGSLRITMAHNGATLSVAVADKDGNPGADLRVLLFPAEVRSEDMLAARLVQGLTNQAGRYLSQMLPPGKYFVMATEESVDATPESIGRLWSARNQFQAVDLTPGATAQVKLEPGKIE